MEIVTYTAPDISCEHCQRAIEGAVGALPGVGSVHVEIPTQRIEVRFDSTRLDAATIEAALDEEGYPVAR